MTLDLPPRAGDLTDFVKVLKLPHVLPIQGPYAIKLLERLTDAYGGSQNAVSQDDILPWSCDTLHEYKLELEDAYNKLRARLPKMTTDAVNQLAREMAELCTESDVDENTIYGLIDQLFAKITEFNTHISDETTEETEPSPSEPTSGLTKAYANTIAAYLNHIFGNSFLSDDIPPLPIDHQLVLDERGEKPCFYDSAVYQARKNAYFARCAASRNVRDIDEYMSDSEAETLQDDLVKATQDLAEAEENVVRCTLGAARAAYHRAVAVGCAIRQALVLLRNKKVHEIADDVLTNATTTAVSLLCCAALRITPQIKNKNMYKWAPLSGLKFDEEYLYYSNVWSKPNDFEDGYLTDEGECRGRHGAGVEAFLGTALHMLGCSQVMVPGPRAWPAVHPKPEYNWSNTVCEHFLDDCLVQELPRFNDSYYHATYHAVLFGRELSINGNQVINRRSTIDGYGVAGWYGRERNVWGVSVTYIDATAARPDLIDPPTAKRPNKAQRLTASVSKYFKDIMCIELKTGESLGGVEEQLRGHRGLSILLAVREKFLTAAHNSITHEHYGRPVISGTYYVYMCGISKCNEDTSDLKGRRNYVNRILTAERVAAAAAGVENLEVCIPVHQITPLPKIV